MARSRLILFDVDGTLIRAYGAGRQALVEAFGDVFGRDDIAGHLDATWFAGRTDLFIFRQLALDAGIAPWEYERRYSDLEDRYLRRLRAAVASHPEKAAMPGVIALLDRLSGGGQSPVPASDSAGRERARGEGGASDGTALGLMTGNLEAGARIKLEPWDLNRHFPSGGFGSDALERWEIGAIARQRFERRLGRPIKPSDVTVVGDTVSDIEAARRCGFRVLAVGTGWTDAETLGAAEPDALLADLSDTVAALRALDLDP